MGLAASQARFLGLTARKSNVEYQGQQVNQQRTGLANESANLYNQMMNLTVPTPPATSDYYTTTYTLENSGDGADIGDYKMTAMQKTYDPENPGQYLVTLSYEQGVVDVTNNQYKLTKSTKTEGEEGKSSYSFRLSELNSSNNVTLNYIEDQTDAYTGNNGSLNINRNQIYEINPDKELDGFEKCQEDNKGIELKYFYQGNDGKNHFLSQDQLDAMKNDTKDDVFAFSTTYQYTKDVSTQVKAYLEQSDSGRYSTIQIEDGEEYPAELKGKTFSLNMSEVKDDKAYEEALNDYQYNKELYEKTISDLNAQTEVLQKEDQQLELRLKQLDTEQNAITTEMESVTKVLQDNVEKTFNVFG